MEGFTLKELFKNDINYSELQFLNKHLKNYLDLYGKPMLPKRTVPGEKWPSNQWPKELIEVTCALLFGFRKINDGNHDSMTRYKLIDDLVDLQIAYPHKKCWGFGVPYYDGDYWMELVEQVTGEKRFS
jgi:hypothetical protein